MHTPLLFGSHFIVKREDTPATIRTIRGLGANGLACIPTAWDMNFHFVPKEKDDAFVKAMQEQGIPFEPASNLIPGFKQWDDECPTKYQHEAEVETCNGLVDSFQEKLKKYRILM